MPFYNKACLNNINFKKKRLFFFYINKIFKLNLLCFIFLLSELYNFYFKNFIIDSQTVILSKFNYIFLFGNLVII